MNRVNWQKAYDSSILTSSKHLESALRGLVSGNWCNDDRTVKKETSDNAFYF